MTVIDTINGVFSGQDLSALDDLQREQVAGEFVRTSAFASAALVAVPVPLSELLLTTLVNVAMLVSLGRLYGQSLSRSKVSKLLAVLLAATGGSLGACCLWVIGSVMSETAMPKRWLRGEAELGTVAPTRLCREGARAAGSS